MGYHLEVAYKPGLENKAVDSLSLMYEEADLKGLISFPIWVKEKQVKQEILQDP